jgi:hypothetical protein
LLAWSEVGSRSDLFRGWIDRVNPVKRVGGKARAAVVVADVFDGIGEVFFVEDEYWESAGGP